MEEIIAVHIINNLEEDDSFNDFTEDAKYCHRPIILGQKRIIFLVKRNDFGYLVQRWKGSLLDGKVNNMSNCWQDVIHHKFDDVSINSVNPIRLAIL